MKPRTTQGTSVAAALAIGAGMASDADPLRRTHRAMRETVMETGSEAPRTLYEAFDLFNERFFEGKLGAPMIWLAPASSPRAAGDYTPRDEHGLVSRIRIAPSIFRQGWREALGTLLHEMVHAWQHEIANDIERGYKGHGPRFAARANEIGAQLGFPPVAPKGRGGLHRAETWPHLPDEAGEIPPAVKPKPAAAESDDVDEDAGENALATSDLRDMGRAAERSEVLSFLYVWMQWEENQGRSRSAAVIGRIASTIDHGGHVGFSNALGLVDDESDES